MGWSSLFWKLLPKGVKTWWKWISWGKVRLSKLPNDFFQCLIRHSLMQFWWNFQFVWTCCGRVMVSKVPKIGRKFPKISEYGILEGFYRLKTFTMSFILDTNFTIYTMHLCAKFHRNSFIFPKLGCEMFWKLGEKSS